MGELCIWYYKHGWNTYLTCSADLCKHTSGCSANKSRLYCPLTSAELPIVNVTQLQRRASTVDWGSLSLTSWLTAATHHSLYQRHETHTHTTPHPLFNRQVYGTSCLRSVGKWEVSQVYQCSFFQQQSGDFQKIRTNMGDNGMERHESFKQTDTFSSGISVSSYAKMCCIMGC